MLDGEIPKTLLFYSIPGLDCLFSSHLQQIIRREVENVNVHETVVNKCAWMKRKDIIHGRIEVVFTVS